MSPDLLAVRTTVFPCRCRSPCSLILYVSISSDPAQLLANVALLTPVDCGEEMAALVPAVLPSHSHKEMASQHHASLLRHLLRVCLSAETWAALGAPSSWKASLWAVAQNTTSPRCDACACPASCDQNPLLSPVQLSNLCNHRVFERQCCALSSLLDFSA